MQKTVIITGVLGGIGRGLAKTFQENQYRVVGLDVRNETSEHSDLFIRFDLRKYCTDPTYKVNMENRFRESIPEIHVLINNAAVQILSKLSEIQLEDWNHTLDVNLTGPLLLSQFFQSQLKQSHGCIINIASIHQQLTKQRFRVNCISPAAIDTSMLREGFNNDENKVQQLNEIHPIQRIGKPAEVSKLALLLAEDELGFINGSNIQIDGGISNVLKDLD